MNQSAFFPRLAAYCMGLPVLLVIYLFSHIAMQVAFPLFVAALFVAIWGQARIRRSYPQDFKLREEWIAFGIFLVLVIISGSLMVKW